MQITLVLTKYPHVGMGMFFAVIDWGFGICYPSGIVVTEKESVRVYVKEG